MSHLLSKRLTSIMNGPRDLHCWQIIQSRINAGGHWHRTGRHHSNCSNMSTQTSKPIVPINWWRNESNWLKKIVECEWSCSCDHTIIFDDKSWIIRRMWNKSSTSNILTTILTVNTSSTDIELSLQAMSSWSNFCRGKNRSTTEMSCSSLKRNSG